MDKSEIVAGVTYNGRGASRPRTVLRMIDGAVVEYRIQGILSFAPQRVPVEQFAAWAIAKAQSPEKARQ